MYLNPRKNLRKPWHNYAGECTYFVTICIDGHQKYFGEIIHGRMVLNDYGEIAHNQFHWLQENFKYVNIPIMVVMPDHIHAIVEIRNTFIKSDTGTGRDLSLNHIVDDFSVIKIKPLPEIIGAYKTTTSKMIHLAGLQSFKWQRSYHEFIILNKKQYAQKWNYIKNNPGKGG